MMMTTSYGYSSSCGHKQFVICIEKGQQLFLYSSYSKTARRKTELKVISLFKYKKCADHPLV